MDLQLPVQSVPITSKVVILNPAQATGQLFYQVSPASSTNKTDRNDITEILLKVALNTINQPTKCPLFVLDLYLLQLRFGLWFVIFLDYDMFTIHSSLDIYCS